MSTVFEIVTGIFNTNTQNLSIYPNPTNGKAYINTDATMYGDMEIQVLDILGKTINTQIIKNTQPNQTILIDLKQSLGGFYYPSILGDKVWEREIGSGVGNEIMKQ
ncbi:MAG: T9SS type A sorting domain-containing protein [Bacteroidetes bacterium]|nr:T9SS type A sorting domain-containing protein [Bacteroidota bacterium]